MIKRVVAALMLAASVCGVASAASVRSLTLDEIVNDAAIAFQGTCIASHVERDPKSGFIVTFTTFAVRDVIKGSVDATHTIKQIGGVLISEGIAFKVDGVPTFAIGQDYVVLLHGVSSIGFSSPVGLGQGSFHVQRDESGARVSNGRDFRIMAAGIREPKLSAGTAKSLAESQMPVVQMDLDEFKTLIRAYTGRVQ